MGGKKWCEYCRINIPYNKKDIENHQATRIHLQNKQKAIKFQRIKIRKQREQKKQNQHQALLGTANIPKAKRGSQLEQQVQQYRNSVIDQGKRAIHRMIAQRTQGLYGAPIQYPDKQDLVLAQNYQQNDEQQNDDSQKEQSFQMWKIDICDKTGEPCFINRITKLVLYEPPKGYVLSQQQKQQWQYLKQICKDKVQVNPDATVNISQWQQVPQQQNYFQVNKVVDSDQDGQNQGNTDKNDQKYEQHKKYLIKRQQNEGKQKQQQKKKTWRQQVQQKLINNQISTNEVFQKFIENEMKNSKSIKQKNQNLKKLIQSGIQIRSRPTDQLLNQENLHKIDKKQLQENNKDVKIQQKSKILFKPRKKVQTSNNPILNDQKDIF